MKRTILGLLILVILTSCATEKPPLIIGQDMVCTYKLNKLLYFEAVHKPSSLLGPEEVIVVRMIAKNPNKYEVGKTYKIYRKGF